MRKFSNTIYKNKIAIYYNPGCKTGQDISLLEENIGKALLDVNHSEIFFDPPPRVMKIKTKINTWDLIINFQNKQTAYVDQYQNNKQPDKKNGLKT